MSYRSAEFTGLLFVTRIMALSALPNHRLYRFSLSRIIVNIGVPSYEWHIIPTYPMSANHGINPYLQIAVYIGYLGCQISRHQPISLNRRSCRLARNHGITRSYRQVSWHRQIRRVTAYLGSSCISARPVDFMSVMPAKSSGPRVQKTDIAHVGNMSMRHCPVWQYVIMPM